MGGGRNANWCDGSCFDVRRLAAGRHPLTHALTRPPSLPSQHSTTLKQKHKVIKKVKQHHKKLAKKAKQDAKAGKVFQKRKDPGVPAAWPHKEELAREVALHAKRAAEVADARRVARAAARDAPPVDEPTTPPTVAALSPDASRRAFGGELARVLADADIVVQVLDARDPASCRCGELERAVARARAALPKRSCLW